MPPPKAEGDKSAAREEFENQLGERIRELYRRSVHDERIPSDCLPQTPQKRKGREL